MVAAWPSGGVVGIKSHCVRFVMVMVMVMVIAMVMSDGDGDGCKFRLMSMCLNRAPILPISFRVPNF